MCFCATFNALNSHSLFFHGCSDTPKHTMPFIYEEQLTYWCTCVLCQDFIFAMYTREATYFRGAIDIMHQISTLCRLHCVCVCVCVSIVCVLFVFLAKERYNISQSLSTPYAHANRGHAKSMVELAYTVAYCHAASSFCFTTLFVQLCLSSLVIAAVGVTHTIDTHANVCPSEYGTQYPLWTCHVQPYFERRTPIW